MHRHVYMMTLPQGSTDWTYPFDIVPSIADGGDGENQEAVFACMAKRVDADACVLYQRDNAPGHALAAATSCDLANNLGNPSDIIYAKVEAATVKVNSVETNNVFVSQNYPNPSHGSTFINVILKKSSDVNITVIDMLGKNVYSDVKSGLQAGTHTIGLNTSGWNTGIYMYTVIAGGQKTTHQMIVR